MNTTTLEPLPLYPPATSLAQVKERTIEILKRGRCKKHFAVDQFGQSSSALDPSACLCCILGAAIRSSGVYVIGGYHPSQCLFDDFIARLRTIIGGGLILVFSDSDRPDSEIIAAVESVEVP